MWSWIGWIVGTVGIGGALLIGAGLIFGWPIIVGTKLGRIALTIGAGLLAVFGIYLKGKAEGRAEKAAQLKALTEKEVGLSAAERRRIDSLPDDQLDKELAQWDRKP